MVECGLKEMMDGRVHFDTVFMVDGLLLWR